MAVAVDIVSKEDRREWLNSHVCSSMAVSRNVARVLLLEVFMLAARRVFFSRVIRLGLGHGEAAFSGTRSQRERRKEQPFS